MTLLIVKAGTLSLPTFITNPSGQLVFTPVLATITGPYIISMIVTDQWGVSSSLLSFTVTVTTDTAPSFSPALPANLRITFSQSIVLNNGMVDAEGNPASVLSITGPSFVTYTVTGINVATTVTPLITSTGSYPVSLTLTDTVKQGTYSFNVVINTAPTIASALVNQNVRQG